MAGKPPARRHEPDEIAYVLGGEPDIIQAEPLPRTVLREDREDPLESPDPGLCRTRKAPSHTSSGPSSAEYDLVAGMPPMLRADVVLDCAIQRPLARLVAAWSAATARPASRPARRRPRSLPRRVPGRRARVQSISHRQVESRTNTASAKSITAEKNGNDSSTAMPRCMTVMPRMAKIRVQRFRSSTGKKSWKYTVAYVVIMTSGVMCQRMSLSAGNSVSSSTRRGSTPHAPRATCCPGSSRARSPRR